MHAFVRGALVGLLLLGTDPRVDAQTSEPLRKTDLIRLLSGGALSHREIADMTHVPLSTVKGRMRLALEKLSSYLQGRGTVDV